MTERERPSGVVSDKTPPSQPRPQIASQPDALASLAARVESLERRVRELEQAADRQWDYDREKREREG